MRRAGVVVVALVLVVGLAGCGGDAVQPSEVEAYDYEYVANASVEEIPAQQEVAEAEEGEETVEELTPEEIREILDSIPWAMVDIPDTGLQWFEQPIVDSETGKRIAIFIDWVYLWMGPPSASFRSPEEIIPDNVWHTSIFNTRQVLWNDPEMMPGAVYHPELTCLLRT